MIQTARKLDDPYDEARQAWAHRDRIAFEVIGAILLPYLGFWLGQAVINQRHHDSITESAQYQIAVIRHEEQAFRNSLICVADTVVAGCLRWERRP